MAAALTLRSLRRAVGERRRLLAALAAAGAVVVGLETVRPAEPPTVAVLAAARDLPAGTTLAMADLRSVTLPPAVVPSGALRPGAAVLGRLVAGPVRRGEPLTDARLVGPSLLSAAGLGGDIVAVPVRLADPGGAALVRPGDRVDVLAASGPGAAHTALDPEPADEGRRSDVGPADVVAADALVLTVPVSDDDRLTAGSDGGLVVLATSRQAARLLARAATQSRLSLALRPQSGG